MVFMKENKNKKLSLHVVGEGIVFMPIDEFPNCLNYIKKIAVWWGIKINDFVGKSKERKQIWTKKNYFLFIGIISRPVIEEMV